MTDSVRNYIDACSKYQQLANRADAMITFIGDVSKALSNNPDTFCFCNVDVPMPMRNGRLGGPDGNQWPSATQIQTLLADLLTAQDDLARMWQGVPANDKQSLVAPATYHPKRPTMAR